MEAIGKLLSRITDFATVLGALGIALMMIHVTLDVVLRYAFDAPLPGTISIVSYYYMVIAAFIPLAFAEQKGGHISVEVMTERLPGWIQRHLAGWSTLLSAVVFGMLTVRTWGEAMSKMDIGASIVQGETSIALWPTYFFLPVGFGLMFLIVAHKFFAYVFARETGLDTQRATPTEALAD